MSIMRMSTAEALALFDAPEPQDEAQPVLIADPEAPMGYAAYHPERGIFLGIREGQGPDGVVRIALWSAMDTNGLSRAPLFEDPEYGPRFFAGTGAATPDMLDDIEYFPVHSGHWRDLQAVGLDVADMPYNGPLASDTQH